MKNVGVTWRLRDVVKEWQKLKKMMNVLLCIQVLKVCLNCWVLATAAIGLKTKQKKASTTLLAEGNATEDK